MYRYIMLIVYAILLYSPVQAQDNMPDKAVIVYGSSTVSCADWVKYANITRKTAGNSTGQTAKLHHYRISYFLLGFTTASNLYRPYNSIEVEPNDIVLYALNYCAAHTNQDIYAAAMATIDHFTIKVHNDNTETYTPKR